jgi:hypothetical protein
VPLIAKASQDPETRRRLDDEPFTTERQRNSVSRTEEQWRSGSGAPFIESSPAVPVPRGVRDTATILPMPAPGVKRQVLLVYSYLQFYFPLSRYTRCAFRFSSSFSLTW